MSRGCKTDRLGTPILLNTVTNYPHRLDSDCWYSIIFSTSLSIPAVTERQSDNEKLVVYWKGVDESSVFTVLFDWNRIPSYNTLNNIYNYNFFINELKEDGQQIFPLKSDNKDIYHCADNIQECVTFKKDSSVKDLYIKFLSAGPVNTTEKVLTKFKVTWEKQNSYIQKSQLKHVRNMWVDCCNSTFTTKVDYKNIFAKQYCDLYLDSLSCENIDFIKCDIDGNVIGFYISSHGLKCNNFVDHLLNFPKLVEIYAHSNSLSGNINKLSSFVSLTSVSVSDNYFTGNIPCFINKKMTVLKLSMNKLTGHIPECIGILTNLNILDISHNPFNIQPFPYFIKMFNKLEILDLRNANLYGKIDNVFNMTSLKLLEISSNQLTGSLPESLVVSTSLVLIDVSNNLFIGTIPTFGEQLTHGIYNTNLFSGNLLNLLIPAPFNLKLDISNNKFIGTIVDDVIKIILTKNLSLNMKGNTLDCDNNTYLWSKSILHMNNILNLDKCNNKVEDNDSCYTITPKTSDIIVLIILIGISVIATIACLYYKMCNTSELQLELDIIDPLA